MGAPLRDLTGPIRLGVRLQAVQIEGDAAFLEGVAGPDRRRFPHRASASASVDWWAPLGMCCCAASASSQASRADGMLQRKGGAALVSGQTLVRRSSAGDRVGGPGTLSQAGSRMMRLARRQSPGPPLRVYPPRYRGNGRLQVRGRWCAGRARSPGASNREKPIAGVAWRAYASANNGSRACHRSGGPETRSRQKRQREPEKKHSRRAE